MAQGLRSTERNLTVRVDMTVSFSQIGQPQAISAPAHYTTVTGKG